MNRKLSISVLSAACVLAAVGGSVVADERVVAGRFEGKYCSGTGDAAWLRLIDESFAYFHANPRVPNLTMVYHPDWDTFQLGANWGHCLGRRNEASAMAAAAGRCVRLPGADDADSGSSSIRRGAAGGRGRGCV